MNGTVKTILTFLLIAGLLLSLLTGCGDDSVISKDTALETYLTTTDGKKLLPEEVKEISVTNIESEGQRFEKERSEFRLKNDELSGFSLVTFKRTHAPVLLRGHPIYFTENGVTGITYIATFEILMYRLKGDTYWRASERPLSISLDLAPLSADERTTHEAAVQAAQTELTALQDKLSLAEKNIVWQNKLIQMSIEHRNKSTEQEARSKLLEHQNEKKTYEERLVQLRATLH